MNTSVKTENWWQNNWDRGHEETETCPAVGEAWISSSMGNTARIEVWSINRLTWWWDRNKEQFRGYLMTQEQELFERLWFLSRTDCRVQSRGGWLTYSPRKLRVCLSTGPLKHEGGREEIKPHIFTNLGFRGISELFHVPADLSVRKETAVPTRW